MDNLRVSPAARHAVLVLAVHFVAARCYILGHHLTQKELVEGEEPRMPSFLQVTIEGTFISVGLGAILGVILKSRPILYVSAICIGAYAATGEVTDETLLVFLISAAILLHLFFKHAVFVVEVCASVSALWGALKIANENNSFGIAQLRELLTATDGLPLWTKLPVLPLLAALIIYVESLRDEDERTRMEMQKNLEEIDEEMEEEEDADREESSEDLRRSWSIIPEREEPETRDVRDKMVEFVGFSETVEPNIAHKSDDFVTDISGDPERENSQTKKTSKIAFPDTKVDSEQVEFDTKDDSKEGVADNSGDAELLESGNDKTSEEIVPDVSGPSAVSETKESSEEIVSEISEDPGTKKAPEGIVDEFSEDPERDEEKTEEVVINKSEGPYTCPRDRGDTTDAWPPRYSKITLTKRHNKSS